ncbi:RNA polymerase sigma factor [Cesiribacter sp. SM1]|uniref:RNA polymerase sigma factor n=1 Tax=Cesiribacter sp. SM1 TaxID=2861196 RepID=UPI001CD535C5|nr:RNA polymerase sigma factor [Cesiribacter sp. SM1]
MSSTATQKSLFESLHRQYQPAVLQMCLGFMKGDRDLAKDLTQEVFINIWNALPGFRGASSYKTWIYRITVNTCLLHIRNNKTKSTVPLLDVPHPVSSGTDDKEEEDYRELYLAIGKLSELDRLIIMMVLEELEYDEISSIVGINPVNLRVKIHRIKKRLREFIEKEQAHG